MIYYAAYSPESGEIIRSGQCQEDVASYQGEFVLVAEHECSDSDWHVINGAPVQYTEAQKFAKSGAPRFGVIWSNATMAWVDTRTLPQAKDDAWVAVKAERARRLAGTFAHAGNTYDIDPVNLSGASIDAREALIAGEPWTQMWVLADNTTATLTAPEMIAVGRACKTAVSGLWATSQYLRGLIEAATTPEQVAAITWP